MFVDRADAGRRLGERLGHVRAERPVVLGLPRGGVAVAYEVARALGAPLDVVLVRKLGVPQQPELAMGAIGEGGVRVVDERVRQGAGVPEHVLAAVEARARAELDRQGARLRAGRPPVDLAGRTVVVVDDGIATGSTARAACAVVRARGARRIVLAVPVAPRASADELLDVADEVVCVEAPGSFFSIGERYVDFAQTSEEEVVGRLRRAPGSPAGPGVEPGEQPGELDHPGPD